MVKRTISEDKTKIRFEMPERQVSLPLKHGGGGVLVFITFEEWRRRSVSGHYISSKEKEDSFW